MDHGVQVGGPAEPYDGIRRGGVLRIPNPNPNPTLTLTLTHSASLYALPQEWPVLFCTRQAEFFPSAPVIMQALERVQASATPAHLVLTSFTLAGIGLLASQR